MSALEWIGIVALFLNAAMVAFTVAAFARGGRWNDKTELAALTRTLTAHDERLKTVEQRLGELPSSAAVTEIKHAVEKMEIFMKGKLETVAMKLEHGEKERAAHAEQSQRDRAAIGEQISRIEDFLINHQKAG